MTRTAQRPGQRQHIKRLSRALSAFLPILCGCYSAPSVQSSAGPDEVATTSADSLCTTLPATSETATLLLNTTLTSKDPDVALPEVYADTVQRIVAAQFHAPPITSFSVISYARTIGAKTKALWFPAFETHIYFYIYRDGSITKPMEVGMSLNPVWNGAFLDAFDAVRQRRLVPPLPRNVSPESVLVVYTVLNPPQRSTTALIPSPLLGGVILPATSNVVAPEKHRMPLVSFTVPTFSDHTPPVLQSRHPFPVYPEVARRAKVQDTVIAAFVIDPTGRPIPSTVDIVKSHYREFITSVAEVIPKLRFRPATVMGCPVNVAVRLPFIFRLR